MSIRPKAFDGPHQAYTSRQRSIVDLRATTATSSSPIERRAGEAFRRCHAVDGIENIKQAAWMNKTPAVIVNIQRQPGANIISVVDRVKQLLPQLQRASAVGQRARC